MIPGLISHEPFVPHTLEHLTENNVFPSPLPPGAYQKMLKDYDAIDDVNTCRIRYGSDGCEVTGLVAEPAGWSPGAHPLLVYNRGGSREYGKLTLLSVLRSMVPYAQKGYIVIASNYRGNDGGTGHEEFGGSDVDDIRALATLAAGHPGYDGRNISMIGHSRGAMMMYVCIRRGMKLNAAMGLAGMADVMQTARERPDIEATVFRRLIPASDAGLQQAYTDRSAVCWPQDIDVPVQLHHGDADKSVDVSQSRHLADALQRAGKPCELYVYPDDNHALLRNWDTVVARTLDWMERYRQ